MTAKEIAQYIISKCASEKRYVNNWKVQYLLYYIQKEFCDIYHEKAFDDPMVAWALGPVVVTVKKDIESIYGPLEIKKVKGKCPEITDERYKKVISKILKDYRTFDFVDLMKTEMKDPDSIWVSTYDNGNGRNKEIPFQKE